MLTLKFVLTIDGQSGSEIYITQGRGLNYQHHEVKTKEEYERFVENKNPIFLGHDVEKTIVDKDMPQAHFIYMYYHDDKDQFISCVMHDGICYVMNENGKTIDVIS